MSIKKENRIVYIARNGVEFRDKTKARNYDLALEIQEEVYGVYDTRCIKLNVILDLIEHGVIK